MGRGSSGKSERTRLTEAQLRRLEDAEQRRDAKTEGARRGAKYYEYTDYNGKVTRGETENALASGGTYKAAYNERIADYAKMTTEALQAEKARLKGISDNQYQLFTRSAASRGRSQVLAFSDADTRIANINQILRRRRGKK